MKLSHKIPLMLMGLTVTTVIVVGLLTYGTIQRELRAIFVEEQRNIAHQTLHSIDRIMNDLILDSEVIADANPIENVLASTRIADDVDQITRSAALRLDEFSLQTGPWDALFVVDLAGKVILSTNKMMQGESIASHDHLLRAYDTARTQNTSFISDVVPSSLSGKNTIVVAAPVRDRSSQGSPVIGMLVAEASWFIIEELLSDFASDVHIVNADGDVIAASSVHHVQDAHHGVVEAKDQVAVSVKQKGHLRYTGYGWSLVIHKTKNIFLAPTRNTVMRLMGVLAIASALLVIVMIFVLRRAVFMPLLSMQKIAGQIVGGDRSVRCEASTNDEIGALAQSFNQMTDTLIGKSDQEKSIARAIPEPYFALDTDGKITSANEAAFAMLGLKEKELLGKSIGEILINNS